MELDLTKKILQSIANKGPERHPLFDQPTSPATNEPSAEEVRDVDGDDAEEQQVEETDGQTNGDPTSDESWRGVPIDDLCRLGLADGTAAKLVEGGVDTIGALADWTAGGKLLIDIAGVGKGKAEKIDDAMDLFWTERNGRQVPSAATSAATPAGIRHCSDLE
jgi:hypothetical protein